MRRVWIVEIDFGDGKGWSSTVGIGLTREAARQACDDWRQKNTADFRVREYLARPENRRKT